MTKAITCLLAITATLFVCGYVSTGDSRALVMGVVDWCLVGVLLLTAKARERGI